MDPNQLIPDHPGEIPKKPALDLDKILLPKKDVPPSTERINAGVLLAQEQSAVLTVQGATQSTPPPLSATPQKPNTPAPPKEKATVQAVETYQGAIESLVEKNNVSVLSIAAAEATRRGGAPLSAEEEKSSVSSSPFFKIILIVFGVLLLAGAVATISYILLKPAASVDVVKEAPAPFINVDETRSFTVPKELLDHTTALRALEEERAKTRLSLGLIARLNLALPVDPVSKKLTPLTAAQILTMVGPSAPDTLVRALNQQDYLFGVHSYDSNQPFLIFKAISYEQAFSGMLAWEYNMRQDLSPLFLRTPPARLQGTAAATSSATTTPTVVQTGFVDRIVENHNARVIENSTKDILLLWAFINRDLLVVTTNEVTLREIISRLKNAPITPTP